MNFIVYIQAALAVLLSLGILIQQRASGLSSTFGGSGAVVVQRRGAERFIYQATIVMSLLFFGLTVVDWYV